MDRRPELQNKSRLLFRFIALLWYLQHFLVKTIKSLCNNGNYCQNLEWNCSFLKPISHVSLSIFMILSFIRLLYHKNRFYSPKTFEYSLKKIVPVCFRPFWHHVVEFYHIYLNFVIYYSLFCKTVFWIRTFFHHFACSFFLIFFFFQVYRVVDLPFYLYLFEKTPLILCVCVIFSKIHIVFIISFRLIVWCHLSFISLHI